MVRISNNVLTSLMITILIVALVFAVAIVSAADPRGGDRSGFRNERGLGQVGREQPRQPSMRGPEPVFGGRSTPSGNIPAVPGSTIKRGRFAGPGPRGSGNVGPRFGRPGPEGTPGMWGSRGGDLMLPPRVFGTGGYRNRGRDIFEAQRHFHHPRRSGAFFFYGVPRFSFGLSYGYWSFGISNCSYPYCYSSPFHTYGFPYVYGPRVVVVNVPTYTYSRVPLYSYDNGYYLSQGQYSGLDSAVDDIRSAWIGGRQDLILRHIDDYSQVAVYLNGAYSYSLPGEDYRDMVRDAMANIQTTSFTVTNVERRSDGAYTLFGRHEFYDVKGNFKSVDVSYTLNGRWVIVAVGSS